MRRVEVIGNAKLYLGDCREVIPELGPVDIVVTDPPYGISWTKPHLKNGNSRAHAGIENDGDVSVRDDALALCECQRAIVFGSFQAPFPRDVRQVLIWQKPGDSGLFGTVAGYRRDVEPIFLCGTWPGEPVARSSILCSKASFRGHAAAEAGHPHVKPVDLLERLISCCQGVVTVLDPFMGSGTTGVAAIGLGRRFIGIELDERYFDIACERIARAEAQPDLFVKPAEPEQADAFGDCQ